jgi:hypothetical protein
MWKWVCYAGVIAAGSAALPAACWADECDALAFEVARATGATVERRTPGNSVRFGHPITSEMILGCPSQNFTVAMRGPFASQDLIALFAVGARVATGVPEQRLRAAGVQCVRRALRRREQSETMKIAGAEIGCTVSSIGERSGSSAVWADKARPAR